MDNKNGNPALIRLVRSKIEKSGPVSFAWFMQQALYHPEHGYYSSGRCAIGRRGDYFTNVSVGPVFGQLLMAQFLEMWQRLGAPSTFALIEQGAHHAEFARDVLELARKSWPDFFRAMRYLIVEPFSILQKRQSQALQSFPEKVEWRKSIDALEPFIGIHFSNELLDAMPVRLINDNVERLVDFDGAKFVFVERPVRTSGKFNQLALSWVDNVAAKLQMGYVLTIDYGRTQPTSPAEVQVRWQHRRFVSPFEQIGYADISANVDWTSIIQCAETDGLRLVAFTDQHHFLTGIISEWPNLTEDMDLKTKRALQTLLHPEMLGRSFQVLALEKNVNGGAPLAGFKFARVCRGARGSDELTERSSCKKSQAVRYLQRCFPLQ